MKYLRLFGLFVKTSIMTGLEYRANFIGALFMTVFEVLWSAASVLLFYEFTDSLGGWSFHESLVVVGLLFMSFGFLDTVIWQNVVNLGQHIRKGTMDFILTKPINSQFHATLQQFRMDRVASIIGGFFLIGYGLANVGAQPNGGQIALFVLLVLGGLLLLYAALIMLGTLAFWVVETEHFGELVFAILEVGRFPSAALPEPLRAIMTFIIPIAFITTVPAEVILGRVTPQFVLYGWVFALILFYICTRFWNFAVRHYGSASS
jgi:ABC-2 type transport system permease protein